MKTSPLILFFILFLVLCGFIGTVVEIGRATKTEKSSITVSTVVRLDKGPGESHVMFRQRVTRGIAGSLQDTGDVVVTYYIDGETGETYAVIKVTKVVILGDEKTKTD